MYEKVFQKLIFTTTTSSLSKCSLKGDGSFTLFYKSGLLVGHYEMKKPNRKEEMLFDGTNNILPDGDYHICLKRAIMIFSSE